MGESSLPFLQLLLAFVFLFLRGLPALAAPLLLSFVRPQPAQRFGRLPPRLARFQVRSRSFQFFQLDFRLTPPPSIIACRLSGHFFVFEVSSAPFRALFASHVLSFHFASRTFR